MESNSFITHNNIKVLFHSLVVRPIRSVERSQRDSLMSKHHYLGFNSLVGESIHYVAEFQNNRVALLGWSAATFKCKPQDSWIGWSQAIQWQRLHFITNRKRRYDPFCRINS